MSNLIANKEYKDFLIQVKNQIRSLYFFYSNEIVRQAAALLEDSKVLQAVALLNQPSQQSIDADTDLSKVQQVVALIPRGLRNCFNDNFRKIIIT